MSFYNIKSRRRIHRKRINAISVTCVDTKRFRNATSGIWQGMLTGGVERRGRSVSGRGCLRSPCTSREVRTNMKTKYVREF